MNECYLLYSVGDILEFLSFPEKDKCELFSIEMDGQKSFIVKIEEEETLKNFKEFKTNPDSTLIGCVRYNYNLQKEDLFSLVEYINKNEQERLFFNK
jgi:hypothetical protein